MQISIIQPNLSCTFLKRARCKFCKSEPISYAKIKNKIAWPDITTFKIISKFTYNKKKTSRNVEHINLLFTPPSFIRSNKEFSYVVDFKSFNPKYNKNWILDPINIFTDILFCQCVRTVWAFNQSFSEFNGVLSKKRLIKHYPVTFDVISF